MFVSRKIVDEPYPSPRTGPDRKRPGGGAIPKRWTERGIDIFWKKTKPPPKNEEAEPDRPTREKFVAKKSL